MPLLTNQWHRLQGLAAVEHCQCNCCDGPHTQLCRSSAATAINKSAHPTDDVCCVVLPPLQLTCDRCKVRCTRFANFDACYDRLCIKTCEPPSPSPQLSMPPSMEPGAQTSPSPASVNAVAAEPSPSPSTSAPAEPSPSPNPNAGGPAEPSPSPSPSTNAPAVESPSPSTSAPTEQSPNPSPSAAVEVSPGPAANAPDAEQPAGR